MKNGGDERFMEEPTLEILTKQYNIIILKHCFPVSKIKSNLEENDINSEEKTIENYKLQYNALREKFYKFPDNKFIVWTGPALLESSTNNREAENFRIFSNWVKSEWDRKGDNIFIWDFYELQTEGGLYFKSEYAEDEYDSHPNRRFARYAASLFAKRIINVAENKGDISFLTGE